MKFLHMIIVKQEYHDYCDFCHSDAKHSTAIHVHVQGILGKNPPVLFETITTVNQVDIQMLQQLV